jgi:hypothetical protein
MPHLRNYALCDLALSIGEENQLRGAILRNDIMRDHYDNDYHCVHRRIAKCLTWSASCARQAHERCNFHDQCPYSVSSEACYEFLYQHLQVAPVRRRFVNRLKAFRPKGRDVMCAPLMASGRISAK